MVQEQLIPRCFYFVAQFYALQCYSHLDILFVRKHTEVCVGLSVDPIALYISLWIRGSVDGEATHMANLLHRRFIHFGVNVFPLSAQAEYR